MIIKSGTNARSISKTKIAIRRTHIKKSNKATKLVRNDNLKLVSLAALNAQQVLQLSRITANKATMKWIGKGNIWSRADINQYIKDERKELAKGQEKLKQYYSFVLLRDNIPIGFISGRKGDLLDAPARHDYDLLLRMFIDAHLTGHGYGTRIIEMFIKKYRGILAHSSTKIDLDKVELVADIDPSNIASIKIHEKNKFTLAKEVIYKGKSRKHLLRYTRPLGF